MSKPAAIPLFGDAYLADTTHLTTEEHGAYLLLMMAAWRQDDCALPDDDKKLARIAGLTPRKWKAVKETLLDFWEVENGRIFQPRLRKEWRFVRQKSEANRKAAEARWESQDTENKESGRCERISERNAPPPPPNNLSSEPDGSSDSRDPPSEPADKPDDTDETEEAIDLWRQCAKQGGWPVPIKITAARRKKLRARLREVGGIDGWRAALERALRSGLLGHDPPTWWDFDFLTRNPENILKLSEGKYDRSFDETPRNGAASAGPKPSRGIAAVQRRHARSEAEKPGEPDLLRIADGRR